MFLLAFLLLLPFSTWAEEPTCSEREVRLDLPGGPFDHIPYYEDGGLQFCYAATAAMMIDYWRLSKVRNQASLPNVSPLEIAVLSGEFGKTDFEKRVKSGEVDSSIQIWQQHAKNHPICSHQDYLAGIENLVPSLKDCKSKPSDSRDAAYFRYLINVMQASQLAIHDLIQKKKTVSHKEKLKTLRNMRQYWATTFDASCGHEKKPVPVAIPKALETGVLKGASELAILRAVLNEICLAGKGTVPFSKNENFDDLDQLSKHITKGMQAPKGCEQCQTASAPQPTSLADYLPSVEKEFGPMVPTWGSKQILEKIDSLLCAPSHQVVGLGYCYDVFWKSAFGKKPTPQPASWSECEMPHSDTIVGRRIAKNGKRQYLIRKSTGTVFGKGYGDQVIPTDHGRTAWVDGELLEKNIRTIYYFKPR